MIKEILSLLTVGSHLLILAFTVMVLLGNSHAVRFLKKRGMLLAFIVAITALSGSLYFSEIAGFEPCKLCWFQRVLMYPLVLILGIALFWKDVAVKRYVVPMSVIGAAIAAYHYVSAALVKAAATSCSLDGPSCFVDYFKTFGYVTIPMMALTAFVMIGLFALFWEKE